VALDNTAGVDSKDARIRVTLSDGATLARSDPPPTRADPQGGLFFDLPPVGGKGKQEITIQVRPAKVGEVTITADAVTADGMQANTSGVTRIEKGKLTLLLESAAAGADRRAHSRACLGHQWRRGSRRERDRVGDHSIRGCYPVLGRVRSNSRAARSRPATPRHSTLPLTAKATGRYGPSRHRDRRRQHLRRGRSDRGGSATRGTRGRADRPGARVPQSASRLSLTVANRGDATVSNVVIRATLPPELKIAAADGGTVGPGSVEWKLSELRSGEQKSFKLSGEGIKLTGSAGITVVALGDAVSNGATVGTPVQGKAEARDRG